MDLKRRILELKAEGNLRPDVYTSSLAMGLPYGADVKSEVGRTLTELVREGKLEINVCRDGAYFTLAQTTEPIPKG